MAGCLQEGRFEAGAASALEIGQALQFLEELGLSVSSCHVVNALIAQVGSTPAPRSTSPVTTRVSGAARSGTATM